MNRSIIANVFGLVLILWLAAGCSDDGSVTPDSGGDVSTSDINTGIPDGYKFFPCQTPGKACNAHDTCAINPICGKDFKCRPSSVMSCDDSLDCTIDTCLGQGMCKNTPKGGTCMLAVKVPAGTTCADLKTDAGISPGPDAGAGDGGASDAGAATTTIRCCFKDGDRGPHDTCLKCESDTDDAGGSGSSSTKWTPANGGTCDDGNSCTKGDYCQNGNCKGTSFQQQCDDGYSCTKTLCDGIGGCLGNKLLADYCLINGACYKDGTNHPTGSCSTCDVKASQSVWTPITNTCMIGGKCYKKGDKSPTGCGECDPSKDTTNWTALANVCLINSKCYKPNDPNPTATCAKCDPTTSTTKWTVTGSYCLIDGVCKTGGTKDKTGCGTCDPTQDKNGWTTLPGACSKCTLFSGTMGKPCTSATQATDCGTTGQCLLTNTTQGVCTMTCTPDNPATTPNEDTCPDKPNNICAGVPLSSGATSYFCLRTCRPHLGCTECDASLVCHLRSGSMVNQYGKAFCLFYKTPNGCTKDSDCYVITGTACSTSLSNCPTGQTCLAYTSSAISTDGICAKDGSCDLISGLCKPHTQGSATAKVGDPCKGDTDCANGMRCNLEFDEKKYRKAGGQSCTTNSDCCSGVCSFNFCTAGSCHLQWRNGYCGISNCLFSSTLTHTACPSGSECSKAFSTGLCQKSCDMTKASDCRGNSADKFGDYDCRAWNNVTFTTVGKVTSGPVCDSGHNLACSRAQAGSAINDCSTLGNTGNTTNMTCRDLKNTILTDPYDPAGFCLDNTASATPPAADGGPAPGDGAAPDAGPTGG